MGWFLNEWEIFGQKVQGVVQKGKKYDATSGKGSRSCVRNVVKQRINDSPQDDASADIGDRIRHMTLDSLDSSLHGQQQLLVIHEGVSIVLGLPRLFLLFNEVLSESVHSTVFR